MDTKKRGSFLRCINHLRAMIHRLGAAREVYVRQKLGKFVYMDEIVSSSRSGKFPVGLLVLFSGMAALS
jgi:hypothetical protein